MNANQVTLSTLTFSSKPTIDETKKLKQKRNAQVVDVTVHELGQLLTVGGHSIHPAIINLEKVKKESNPNSIKDSSALAQNVFALDIDHGNYTVEELVQRALVPPNLIYETHSSKPGTNRYRMLFFATQSVPHEPGSTAIRMVNKCLSLPFFSSLAPHQKEIVDTQCINESRIFYNGTRVVYEDEAARFNPFDFLTNESLCLEAETVFSSIKAATGRRTSRAFQVKKAWKAGLIPDEQWETFSHNHEDKVLKASKEAWSWNVSLAQSLGLDEPEAESTPNPVERPPLTKDSTSKESADKHPKSNPSPKPSVYELLSEDRKRLAEHLLTELAALPKEGFPLTIDVRDAYAFMCKLPLHTLLHTSLNTAFPCVLHDDKNPSASIFKGQTDGSYLYNCYGCLEKPMRVGDFFNQVFAEAYRYDVWDTAKAIFKALGIQLGSEYQRNKSYELDQYRNFLFNLPDDHPFRQLLAKAFVEDFFLTYLDIAKYNLPFTPVTVDGRHGFFVSMTTIKRYCTRAGVSGTRSVSAINQKINFLAYLGLIKKINHKDLKEGFLLKAARVAQKQEDARLLGDKSPRNLVSYYELIPLTQTVFNEAIVRYQAYKKSGAKKKSFTATQVTALHGEAVANEVYVQTPVELNSKEQLFLKQALAKSEHLLKTQGYWTERQICSLIDPKGNHWKSKEKHRLLGKFLPVLYREHQIERRCLGKALRAQYQIPEKIKSHSWIYTK